MDSVAGAGAGVGDEEHKHAGGDVEDVSLPAVELGKPMRIYIAVRIKPDSVSAADMTKKHISAWDARKGTVSISGTTFKFPSCVLPPEVSQVRVFNTVLPPLIDAFVSGCDVNLLAFGQTGSGKTHTMFGPPGSVCKAQELIPDHGIFLRAALAALHAVRGKHEGGQYASLTGSMVELHFDMLEDLLHNHAACSIGPAPEYRIRGAQEVTLRDDSDVFKLASAVEERTVRGTRMNDTSSRSHCVTTLKLSMLDTGAGTVRTSRFQFFDMMGSERSKGATSAHDPTQNNKKKLAGMEGIVANMSLSQLSQITSVLITSQRRARKGAIATPPTLRGFPPNLMQMLAGSLGGSAATAMICTLSQIPINGNETWHSLSYAKELSPLLALPKRQKAVNVGKAVAELIKLGGDTWTGVVPAAAATNKYVKMRALNAQDAARDLAVLRDLARGAEYELPATASGGGGKKSKGSSRRSRARCK